MIFSDLDRCIFMCWHLIRRCIAHFSCTYAWSDWLWSSQCEKRNAEISNDLYVNTRLLSWHPSALIEKNRGDGIDLVQIWIYNLNWQSSTDSSIARTNIPVIIMMIIIIMVIIIARAHTHIERAERRGEERIISQLFFMFAHACIWRWNRLE